MKHPIIRWIAGAAAMASGAVCAQLTFPVNLPQSKAGEIVRYRTVDLWNNQQLSAAQIELVEVQTDRFLTRIVSSNSPQPATRYFTREWQPCRSLKNSDQLVCQGSFKFPMQPGSRHSYEKLPWPNGEGFSSSNCEVKGEEKVAVPAGTFDTVRIECAGFWTRLFGGNFGGSMAEKHWYAPQISRMVKSEYVDYTAAGSVYNKTRTELTEFSAK